MLEELESGLHVHEALKTLSEASSHDVSDEATRMPLSTGLFRAQLLIWWLSLACRENFLPQIAHLQASPPAEMACR